MTSIRSLGFSKPLQEREFILEAPFSARTLAGNLAKAVHATVGLYMDSDRPFLIGHVEESGFNVHTWAPINSLYLRATGRFEPSGNGTKIYISIRESKPMKFVVHFLKASLITGGSALALAGGLLKRWDMAITSVGFIASAYFFCRRDPSQFPKSSEELFSHIRSLLLQPIQSER